MVKLLAACDSSRKPRIWKALRAAVRARRAELARRDPYLNPIPDPEGTFGQVRTREPAVNRPRGYVPDADHPRSPTA